MHDVQDILENIRELSQYLPVDEGRMQKLKSFDVEVSELEDDKRDLDDAELRAQSPCTNLSQVRLRFIACSMLRTPHGCHRTGLAILPSRC